MYTAIEKIPGGKLVRITVDYDKKTNKLKNVIITGDFFAHPEKSIDEIQNILKNKEFVEQKLEFIIKEYVELNQVYLVGIDPESIIRIIKKAIDK